MASYCPKCNYKLSLVDLAPECPVCGVNLVYYGMEDKLKKEADKAEYEHAKTQPHFDRLKSGTIGNPLAIVRLVICILPLVATLVPVGKIAVTLPFSTQNFAVNIITVVKQIFMNLDFDFYMEMIKAPGVGKAYIFFLIALVMFVLTAVFAIVNLINLMMAAAPRGFKRNFTIAGLGLGTSILTMVFYALYASALSAAMPAIFSGSVSAGVIAIPLTFVAEIVINVIYKKKNIPVKYKDVSKYLLAYDERDHSGEEKDVATVEVEL